MAPARDIVLGAFESLARPALVRPEHPSCRPTKSSPSRTRYAETNDSPSSDVLFLTPCSPSAMLSRPGYHPRDGARCEGALLWVKFGNGAAK
jgi:hypothetical protein